MDYLLQGTQTLMSYMNSLGLDNDNLRQRVAASIGVPIIHFRSSGQSSASFQRKISESQAQSLASLMGVSIANLKTNGGLVQLP